MFEPKFRREDFFSDAELQALGQIHLLQNVLPVEVSVEERVLYQTSVLKQLFFGEQSEFNAGITFAQLRRRIEKFIADPKIAKETFKLAFPGGAMYAAAPNYSQFISQSQPVQQPVPLPQPPKEAQVPLPKQTESKQQPKAAEEEPEEEYEYEEEEEEEEEVESPPKEEPKAIEKSADAPSAEA